MALPYKKQIKLAQMPLSIGGSVSTDFGDVLIVPGSGCNPGRGTEERLNLASSLYKQKRRKLIVSEGTCFPHERAGFSKRMVTEWGFEREDIFWDTLSYTTEENVLNAQEFCKKINAKDAIICTSKFHQLRCGILMWKHWDGEYEIAKMPKEFIELDKEEVYINKRGRVLKLEYAKCLYELLYFFD